VFLGSNFGSKFGGYCSVRAIYLSVLVIGRGTEVGGEHEEQTRLVRTPAAPAAHAAESRCGLPTAHVRWPEACLALSAREHMWGAEQTARCTADQQAAVVSAAKASSAQHFHAKVCSSPAPPGPSLLLFLLLGVLFN
jgi:hypothetical protein